MTRTKKAMLTSIFSFMHQAISIICGFILPRIFLRNYGSTVNGLVTSITQFLGFISLAECGIGSVVQSSLYKPLAQGDEKKISQIFKSSNSFFRTIGIILTVYTLILAAIYPYIVKDKFDFVYSSTLVLIISISTFAQHYVGMSYRLVLGADQCGFYTQILSCLALIVNTILCVILINNGFGIHIVKLVSSLIFLTQPFILIIIAKKRYNIDRKIEITEEPIKQKWNGLAQHVASVVTGNTDTIVLTLLSTLENVSIYGVYFLVVNGVRNLISSFTSGFIAMFGNMLAKHEDELLKKSFSYFEWVIHTITTYVFGLTGLLILPFIKLYTRGISDVNYIVPAFGSLMVLAQASYCLRLPYNIMVLAAGHYKQTQVSALVEAIINIVLSVFLVFHFGLIGVAIGTLGAMIYRTVYLANYIFHNIIPSKMSGFLIHCLVDFVSVICMYGMAFFIQYQVISYYEWMGLAVVLGSISFAIVLLVNLLFYKQFVISFIGNIYKRLGFHK